jgi:DNA-binding NtrC family response regulator
MPAHLPKIAGSRAPTPEPQARDGSGVRFETGRGLDYIEREYILATLKSVNNDRKRAAQLLGVSLRTLYSRSRRLSCETGTWYGRSTKAQPAE